MKIYLAGPMTGYRDHNYPIFHKAAKILRDMDYEVISPAELHPEAITVSAAVAAANYADYYRKNIAALLTCDALVLLSGWQYSGGALGEAHNALLLRMRIGELWQMSDAAGIVDLPLCAVRDALRNYFMTDTGNRDVRTY